MKYLLSEDEYAELKEVQVKRRVDKDAQLQKLCTLAANHIPVELTWKNDDDPDRVRPWGCEIDKTFGTPVSYCDDCPCSHVCPNENKKWSK